MSIHKTNLVSTLDLPSLHSPPPASPLHPLLHLYTSSALTSAPAFGWASASCFGFASDSAYCVGSYFQILAMQSPLPLAKWGPCLARSILITLFLCPWSMNCACPVCIDQNWIERSLDPETTHCPSGEMATERT
jgi:hypothetical protein